MGQGTPMYTVSFAPHPGSVYVIWPWLPTANRATELTQIGLLWGRRLLLVLTAVPGNGCTLSSLWSYLLSAFFSLLVSGQGIFDLGGTRHAWGLPSSDLSPSTLPWKAAVCQASCGQSDSSVPTVTHMSPAPHFPLCSDNTVPLTALEMAPVIASLKCTASGLAQ